MKQLLTILASFVLIGANAQWATIDAIANGQLMQLGILEGQGKIMAEQQNNQQLQQQIKMVEEAKNTKKRIEQMFNVYNQAGAGFEQLAPIFNLTDSEIGVYQQFNNGVVAFNSYKLTPSEIQMIDRFYSGMETRVKNNQQLSNKVLQSGKGFSNSSDNSNLFDVDQLMGNIEIPGDIINKIREGMFSQFSEIKNSDDSKGKKAVQILTAIFKTAKSLNPLGGQSESNMQFSQNPFEDLDIMSIIEGLPMFGGSSTSSGNMYNVDNGAEESDFKMTDGERMMILNKAIEDNRKIKGAIDYFNRKTTLYLKKKHYENIEKNFNTWIFSSEGNGNYNQLKN